MYDVSCELSTVSSKHSKTKQQCALFFYYFFSILKKAETCVMAAIFFASVREGEDNMD